MRTKKAVFLLPVFFCCCLALWLNSCKRKEVPTEKGPDLAKFNSYLKTQQETFKEQFTQVKKQYPIVALAFAMQEAAIAEPMQLQKVGINHHSRATISHLHPETL